jgi:hypothetical protein
MHGITPAIVRVALGAAALAVTLHARAEPTIAPTPARPAYGQPILVDLLNTVPYFLPSMRYVRLGNGFTIEYEASPNEFGPFPPSIGTMPLSLGELEPGNYTVTARMFDMDHPQTMLSTATVSVTVAPPDDFGVYTVPTQPHAGDNVGILLRSAAYFDPSMVHLTVLPGLLRIDYTYDPSLAMSAPAGETNYYTVHTGPLPPGAYHIEVWGRAATGGLTLKAFERDIVVNNASVVVEYYNQYLDHYFMTAGSDEIALLDGGQQGAGWKRTGQSFAAWTSASLAPPQARPVCRFYAKGPNSHFYTADANECEQLKQLESAQRAEASGRGSEFLGWAYEGTPFYALVPQDGKCPGGTSPVYRTYNGRAMQNDSNHRFMTDSRVRDSMVGWTEEGVAFCTPA